MNGLLPDNVRDSIAKRWPHLAEWSNWAERDFDAWISRTGGEIHGVFHARYALVVDVELSGIRVVYRSTPDPDAQSQVAVASALSDVGAGPQILEFGEATIGTWSTSIRIFPGYPLGDHAGPSNLDLQRVAEALTLITGRPPPRYDLPPVTAWLRRRLEIDTLVDLPPNQRPASTAERRTALGLLDELENSGEGNLCHGDASPWNLLTGTEGRVWMIDPRGVAGTVAYDAAVILSKAPRTADQDVMVRTFSKVLNVEVQEIKAWMTIAGTARV